MKKRPVLYDNAVSFRELRALESKGVELVLCSTCLATFGLADQVAVGVVGGMGDIITAMLSADNTVTL